MKKLYSAWIDYAKTNEENKEFIEYLVHLRTGLDDVDETLVQTYLNAGIIGCPDPSGEMFEEFLNEIGYSLTDLGFKEEDLFRFGDGFIIPVWSTGYSFLHCINHNKDRVSGIEAKYINIYPSGKEDLTNNLKFYGLENSLKAFETGNMYVCEGVFDKLMLEHLGLPVVATLGSKITTAQIRVLNRFDKVTIIGDNDVAGRKSKDILLSKVKNVDVINIPYEKDIDDLGKKRMNVLKEVLKIK